MKEPELKPYSLFSHISQTATFPKHKWFDDLKEYESMRDWSPGPQAYNYDSNYISNPEGKAATFFKEKWQRRKEETSPGPSDYELKPHLLSWSYVRSSTNDL